MSEFYTSAPIAIRKDLAGAHACAWARIGRPGTWWDAAGRIAIAAETRHAPSCALCRRRKAALSPAAIEGKHDSRGALPEIVVEVVHRVRTDPGRLSERWFRGVIAAGLNEEQYVETVSIVGHVVAIDTMARGLGLSEPALPQPQPGMPSRYRPAGAKPGGAWVPWLEPADLSEAEAGLYPAGGEHHEGNEPRTRRGAQLLRLGVAPVHAAARDARLFAGIPGNQPLAGRAPGGAGVGAEPVSLLNDQSHLAAPCERRDPQ